MSVPVIHMDAQRAADAFEAYANLRKIERAQPSLRENPVWTTIVQNAFAAFWTSFEAQK